MEIEFCILHTQSFPIYPSFSALSFLAGNILLDEQSFTRKRRMIVSQFLCVKIYHLLHNYKHLYAYV